MRMKNTRLENICTVILGRWEEGKAITEKQADIFMEEILELFTGSTASRLPESYSALYRKLKEMRHYHETSQMTPQDAFLLGSIWSGMELVEKRHKKEAENVSLDDLACKYKSYEWFFSALKANPGLNHAQLAKRGNKTPSELSQFTTRIGREKLYNANRLGREKYYFLSPRGEELLGIIKRNRMRDYESKLPAYAKKIDMKNEMQHRDVVVKLSPDIMPYYHFPNSFIGITNEAFYKNISSLKVNSIKGGIGKWSSVKQNLYSNSMNNYPDSEVISLILQGQRID